MNITVYTSFSKRKNSTKQPTGGTAVTCDIKHTNSMRNPIFHINKDDLTGGITPESIKYVKDSDHSIYYYVDDVEYVPNKFYALHCTIDPMATYKSSITGSTQYVMYSASNYSLMIPDHRIYNTENKCYWVYHSLRKADNTALKLDTTGCYVVTAVSCKNAASTTGLYAQNFVTRYLVNDTNIKLLGDYLFDTALWGGSNFEANINKMVQKPYNSLISIYWLPIPYGPLITGQSEEPVQLGQDAIVNQGTPVASYLIPENASYTYKGSVTPSWNYIDDWRLGSPTTTASLYVPSFGLVDINPIEYRDGLDCETYIDILSGETITKLVQNSVIKATFSYNIATQIPVAQTTPNTGTAITKLVGGIGAAAAGVATGGVAGVAGIAGGVMNASMGLREMFTMTPSYKGSQGGKAWIDEPEYYLTERYVATQDLSTPQATQGRPLMQAVTLSTLSGYCQCADASVSINGFDADRDIINGYLNSGFYIE